MAVSRGSRIDARLHYLTPAETAALRCQYCSQPMSAGHAWSHKGVKGLYDTTDCIGGALTEPRLAVPAQYRSDAPAHEADRIL